MSWSPSPSCSASLRRRNRINPSTDELQRPSVFVVSCPFMEHRTFIKAVSMKYITFSGSGLLTGLSIMLSRFGIDADAQQIAFGTEMPRLFLHKDGQYYAGSRLFQPEWMNLYLNALGLHLSVHHLIRREAPAFLRSHAPAMLALTVSPQHVHPVVFTGYQNGRYEFLNIRKALSPEPDALSLSADMLRRRLTDDVTAYTLEACERRTADFAPLLRASLHALTDYQNELLKLCTQTLTREQFFALKQPFLRALLQDAYPMAVLLEDVVLSEHLRELNHRYRHIFVRAGESSAVLSDYFSKRMLCRCILWLQENIHDRLAELGAEDTD